MNFKFQIFNFKKETIISALILMVLGFVLLQLPINILAGSRVKFTAFDLFAPIAASFAGLGIGAVSVLVVQIANIVFHGTAVDRGVIIRLLPTLFALWYFSRKSKYQLLFPILAIISFNLSITACKIVA